MFGFNKNKCDARDKSTSNGIVYYLNCFCEWCEEHHNIVKYTPISVQVDNELLITENQKLKEEIKQLYFDIAMSNKENQKLKAQLKHSKSEHCEISGVKLDGKPECKPFCK